MHHYPCGFIVSFSLLALTVPNTYATRSHDLAAFAALSPSIPCMCDRCKSDVAWFDFSTIDTKGRCHLSSAGYGWWCKAHSSTESCACSRRKYSLRYGYWIPCGKGSGHLAHLISYVSRYDLANTSNQQDIVAKGRSLVEQTYKEKYVAEETKDADRSSQIHALQPLIEILPDVLDILDEHLHHLHMQEEMKRATARLEVERRILEEVGVLLNKEATAMMESTPGADMGRTELAQAMDVCRYNLDQYYGRSASMTKREPRDFMEEDDPCRSHGGGRFKKVAEDVGEQIHEQETVEQKDLDTIQLMELCRQRDSIMGQLMLNLQRHAESIPGRGKYAKAFVEASIAFFREGGRISRFQVKLDREMGLASPTRHMSDNVLGLCKAFVQSVSDLRA